MSQEDKTPQQGMIQISTGDEMSRGRYSNNMLILHSREEFIMDWLLNSPAGTHLVSRIVVSPGHVKRIIGALVDNLRKYEEKYGPITPPEPKDQAFH
jgi:hypothetical protein